MEITVKPRHLVSQSERHESLNRMKNTYSIFLLVGTDIREFKQVELHHSTRIDLLNDLKYYVDIYTANNLLRRAFFVTDNIRYDFALNYLLYGKTDYPTDTQTEDLGYINKHLEYEVVQDLKAYTTKEAKGSHLNDLISKYGLNTEPYYYNFTEGLEELIAMEVPGATDIKTNIEQIKAAYREIVDKL